MPHVCVERFAAGDHEEHRTEHREADEAVGGKERDGVAGIEGAQDTRQPRDPGDAECGERYEPDDHDRTEEAANAMGSVLLNHEQPDQDDYRDWDYVLLEQRRRHFETLDGTEHADRRRDHAIAVEQRRAEDAERDQNGATDRQS